MKANVIFHSVCGNTLILARWLQAELLELGVECGLFRVNDPDAEELARFFPIIAEMAEEIRSIPLAHPGLLQESDLVVMGSPTYFGNVSSEMKTFMDSAAPFWPEAKLAGRKIAAFATAGTPEGGAPLSLQAIRTWGTHMGMIPLPVPVGLVPGTDFPAYGLTAYSGSMADSRPDEAVLEGCRAWAAFLVEAAR